MIISEEVLIKEIINKKQTALVLVSSRWNGAAQIARSGFDELKRAYSRKVRFNRLVTEELETIKESLNLGYSSSWLFFHEGELFEVLEGLRPAEEVKAHLDEMLKQVRKDSKRGT